MNNYYVKNGSGIYINTADTVADLGMDAFSRSYTDCLCCTEASANSITGDVSAVASSAVKSAGALDNLTASIADLTVTNSVDSVDTVADSVIEIKDRLFILEKKLEAFEKHENLRNKIGNTIYRSICNEWERRSAY